MRKLLTIIILVSFIYCNVGFILVYPFLSEYFKYLGSKISDNLDLRELVLITLSKEEISKNKINLRWINVHEFIFNERYYDILKQEESNLYISFFCVSDDRENNLYNELKKKIKKNSDEDNAIINNTASAIMLTEAEYVITEKIFWDIQSIIKSTCYNSYNSFYSDVPSPPPRFV